jgi:hypothetical protein
VDMLVIDNRRQAGSSSKSSTKNDLLISYCCRWIVPLPVCEPCWVPLTLRSL